MVGSSWWRVVTIHRDHPPPHLIGNGRLGPTPSMSHSRAERVFPFPLAIPYYFLIWGHLSPSLGLELKSRLGFKPLQIRLGGGVRTIHRADQPPSWHVVTIHRDHPPPTPNPCQLICNPERPPPLSVHLIQLIELIQSFQLIEQIQIFH